MFFVEKVFTEYYNVYIGERENQMDCKDIRKLGKLTQKELSQKLGIPLQTIKNWESANNSKSHRECPEYVLQLMEYRIKKELEENGRTQIQK